MSGRYLICSIIER